MHISIILIIITCSLFSACAPDNEIKLDNSITDINDIGAGWTLFWYDDFNTQHLDPAKWNIDTGNGDWGWGNQELQNYQQSNISIQDGNLIISAKRESLGKCLNNTIDCLYTSGKITTKSFFSTRYGKIEARIKIPSGTGLWPAFWMLPNTNNWPSTGEIDIMESKGRVSHEISGALHWGKSIYSKITQSLKLEYHQPFSDDFHVYGVTWNSSSISFHVDGTVYYTVNISGTGGDDITNPFGSDPDNRNDSFYLILNLAIGGNFDSHRTPPETFTSELMIVDWVRVAKPK